MAIVKLDNGKLGEISDAIYDTSISYDEVKENIYENLTKEEKDQLDNICSFCYALSSSCVSKNDFDEIFDSINLVKALNIKTSVDINDNVSIYKYFDILKLSQFFKYDFDSFMALYKTTNVKNYDSFFQTLLAYKRKMDGKAKIKLELKKFETETTIELLARYFSVSVEYVYNLYSKGLTGDEIFSKVYEEKKYHDSMNKLMEVLEFTELNEIGSINIMNYYTNLMNKKRTLISSYINSKGIDSISLENFLTLFIHDYTDCNIEFYNESDYELIDKCKNMLLDLQQIDKETLSCLLFIAMNKKPNKIYNTELFKQIYSLNSKINNAEKSFAKVINISNLRK